MANTYAVVVGKCYGRASMRPSGYVLVCVTFAAALAFAYVANSTGAASYTHGNGATITYTAPLGYVAWVTPMRQCVALRCASCVAIALAAPAN